MSRWALVSGLQGDLELYEAIQRDLRQLGRVDTLGLPPISWTRIRGSQG
jgi:hypothetical protein